jgi:hypothetical protein
LGAGNEKRVQHYSVVGEYANEGPKNWTFEYSDDNSNWYVGDTQTDQSWGDGSTPRYYHYINVVLPHRYYRLNITANCGDMSVLVVHDWGLYE